MSTHRTNYTHAQPAVVKQQYDPRSVWDFENQWHTKLLSCKPMGRCCFSCFCMCCMGCKLSKNLGESSIAGCCPCAVQYMRTKLRTARRIQGSCCGDTCASSCCLPCAATQLANELESQGLWDGPKTRKTYPRNERQQAPPSHQYTDDY